jgi:formamidopyrimidine-DNA glycosylase
MPELPEVETARRVLHERATGRRVLAVATAQAGGGSPFDGLEDQVVLCTPADVRSALVGRRVLGTGRHGKRLWLCLAGDGPGVLALHFGMQGALHYHTPPPQQQQAAAAHLQLVGLGNPPPPLAPAWPPPHTKLELALEGGLRLALTEPDARRLARVRPYASALQAREGLGVDALLELPPAPVLRGLLASARPIKALLLDQSILAGVGNYLADEVLLEARIHPASAAAAVAEDDARLRALHGSLASVVSHAVRVEADAARYPAHWLYHRRWGGGLEGGGEATTRDGSAIEWSTVGGRVTAAVPAVQGLPLPVPLGARVRGSRPAAAAAAAAAVALATAAAAAAAALA